MGQAVKSGRLRHSVNAAGKIVDVELAKREFLENTDRTEAPNAVIANADRIRASLSDRVEAPPEFDSGPLTPAEFPAALTMGEASLAEKHWKSKQAELKYRQAAGELVPARDVEQKLVDTFMACRAKLLGVPSRVRQTLPHLTVADVAAIEAAVREALEALADHGVTLE